MNVHCVIIGFGTSGLNGHIPAMVEVGGFHLDAVVTRSAERWAKAKASFPDV
jgi:predicted dehydrogenase